MIMRRFHVLCLLALAAFAITISISAQTPPVVTPEVVYSTDAAPVLEFYGVVQSINQQVLLINGQMLRAQDGFDPALLLVGDVVRVTAPLLPDGTIDAAQIERVPPGGIPGFVLINGVITERDVAANTISIGGLRIYVSGASVHTATDIGTVVRVFAQISGGQWQALAVIPVQLTSANTPLPPVTTPEVGDDSDDDDSGQGRGRGRGGDG